MSKYYFIIREKIEAFWYELKINEGNTSTNKIREYHNATLYTSGERYISSYLKQFLDVSLYV